MWSPLRTLRPCSTKCPRCRTRYTPARIETARTLTLGMSTPPWDAPRMEPYDILMLVVLAACELIVNGDRRVGRVGK